MSSHTQPDRNGVVAEASAASESIVSESTGDGVDPGLTKGESLRAERDAPNSPDLRPTIWTVGHSTRPISEFLAILASASITVVGDVRRFPGSRKFPQYNQEPLEQSLSDAGIHYYAMSELGGRRKSRPDSPHTVWRNESFRAYADYMDTPAFKEGVEDLLALAARERLAIMCSEALWWRCHRSLIADHLKIRGHRVIHLFSDTKHQEHPYTSAATVVDGQVSYAAR